MVEIIEISQLEDERLCSYVSLTEAQLRNRLEPEKGIFIAESPKVIELALDCGLEPVSVLTERRHIGSLAAGVLKRLESATGRVPCYTADESLLSRLTGYELYRGVLCEMKRPRARSCEEVCRGASRIAVLEDIADSVNVGALVRSAAALGMDAVLFTPSCCDPLCRRAVRVSMGTVFKIPFAFIGSSRDEWLKSGIELLHRLGFETAAMALREDSVGLDSKRLLESKRLAVILGSEGYGLCENTIAKSDYVVRIPMSCGVDSLNVAAAGAIAFWQLRKR